MLVVITEYIPPPLYAAAAHYYLLLLQMRIVIDIPDPSPLLLFITVMVVM